MDIKMDADALQAFLIEVFPQVHADFQILEVTPTGVRVKLATAERHLRPGGTISGPTMFALADVGMYLAILSRIGPEALAVTTNCSIDFMRKPAAGVDLICEAVLHKMGRVLAVGDCMIYSEGLDVPVARASLTYSMPLNCGVK
ncbi:MAG: PaaI family thioesterase [Yoonia sp.]|nr:PaaI family thioesterase [Yoonia sp.]